MKKRLILVLYLYDPSPPISPKNEDEKNTAVK